MKDIDTLLPDIYTLLTVENPEIKKENLEEFVNSIVGAVKEAIETPQSVDGEAKLRLSKTGTGLRRVWFEHNQEGVTKTAPDPLKAGPNLMRFLTGHIIEALLILLAKESGHSVEHAQKEVELEGIVGHCDAVIDGYVVDIKTASQFSYDKFRVGDISTGNDPFGYVAQLCSYRKALQNEGVELKPTSYFWAYNKSNSDMILTPLRESQIVDSAAMLRDQKRVIDFKEPPKQLCFPEEASGKSGNMSINKNCVFCPFKRECFKDANDGQGLRVFKYAKGDAYLSKVVVKPDVEEVT